MDRALVCIDFVNDIISDNGKLAGKGYREFTRANDTLTRVAELQRRMRSDGNLVVHVRLGFSPTYDEHPPGSPLFGPARQFRALELGSWGTEFPAQVAPSTVDIVLTKHRVSAFFGTPLDLILRSNGVREICIAGVATDLAVEAAARDAHDRDYQVTVFSYCCAAATIDDHEGSLRVLRKIATVREA